jgi:hypothetical protein
MKNFIKDNFTIIVFSIALLGLLKSCGDGRELSKMRKEIESIKDSTFTKNELNVKLQIEGLKSEKRMIQSTDRKILDVNRQTEIDNEITNLQNNIK